VFVIEFLEVIQADQQPIIFRKLVHRPEDLRSPLVFNRLLFRVTHISPGPLADLELVYDNVFYRHFLPGLSRPQEIPRRVRGDSIEPGRELRVSLEKRRASPHLDEDFSQRFLCILVIAQHPIQKTVDGPLVPSQQ